MQTTERERTEDLANAKRIQDKALNLVSQDDFIKSSDPTSSSSEDDENESSEDPKSKRMDVYCFFNFHISNSPDVSVCGDFRILT